MHRQAYATDIEGNAKSPEIGPLLLLYDEIVGPDGRAPFSLLWRRVATELAPDLVVLKSDGAGDFLYTHYGANVAAVAGADMTGRLTSEFGSENGRFFRECYGWVAQERRPLFTINRAEDGTSVHLWERLILPCRDRDGSDRLVALVKPREFRADLLDAVLDASRDAIIAIRVTRDADGLVQDGQILAVNRRMAERVNLTVAEMRDKSVRAVLPALFEGGDWERYLEVLESQEAQTFETHTEVDGLDLFSRITAAPFADGLMISITDITDLKLALLQAEAAREEMRRISLTDGLTGVMNRRGFDSAVRNQTASARRYRHPVSVIALDLDHFKRVNDTFGHAAGDCVLMSVASILMEETRTEIDVVGRVGGEEFMMLLPHTALAGAAAVAERIRSRVAASPVLFGDVSIPVTASLGVREFAFEEDPEKFLIDADEALYEAKHTGRNRVVTRMAPLATLEVVTSAA
jgi:diguanylate cyclase (GGDEF)-like protein